MAESLKYEYDVFISYRKTDVGKYWVSKYFAPCLKHELSEILGREARIYYDENDIMAGQHWPTELKRALVLSKCLVPVFSGTYFHSEWCSLEFSIIKNRQNKCHICGPDQSLGIIVPILVRDGDHLPTSVREIQCKEMHDYYTECEAFKSSLDYREFEKAVKNFAEDVAKALEKAPTPDKNWFEDQWLNVSINEVFNNNQLTINVTPTLK